MYPLPIINTVTLIDVSVVALVVMAERCCKKRKKETWSFLVRKLPHNSLPQLEKLESEITLQCFMNIPIKIRHVILQNCLGEGDQMIDPIMDITNNVG